MSETDQRRRQLAGVLVEKKLDALLAASLANVRYLTGFTGSNGMVLVTRESALLLTDPRYRIQASEESDCTVKVVRGPLIHAVAPEIRRRGLKKVGFEKDHLTFDQHTTLSEQAPLGTTLKPVAGLVERLRMVKSEAEIGLIRQSVATNSKAFERTLRKVKPGVRESEIAAELEYQMRRLGAEKPAFETIVALGERTALPHAQPGSRRAQSNELLLIDMGASQGGYTSDMTRTLFLGRPSRRASRMYAAVLEAQLAAIDVVRAGVAAGEVDRTARRVLSRHGLAKAFVHSTGHGLGLEIHELPRVARKDQTRLEAGMVITVEPGAYIEGFGGVRIEDTVRVTGNGREVLTPTPKELLSL